MQVLRLGLAVVCLLVWGWPSMAAGPEAAGKVEHVPPQEAFAILGSPVTAPDGKMIGRLVDVLVNAAGTPEAAVIDVGGFMGVGARKIAVHWSVLHFAPANPKHPITLDLTLDQIKAAPEFGNPSKPAPVVLPVKAPTKPGGAPTPVGATPAGTPPTGAPPTGAPPTGAPPTGASSTGAPPTGAPPTGTPPTGTPPTGASSTGTAPTGTSPTGTSPTGTAPTGTSPTGTAPMGTTNATGTGSGATAGGTTGSGTTGANGAPNGTPNETLKETGSGATSNGATGGPAAPPKPR